MDAHGNTQETGEEAKKILESFLEVIESDYILELGCVSNGFLDNSHSFWFKYLSALDLKKYFGPDYFVKRIKNTKFSP